MLIIISVLFFGHLAHIPSLPSQISKPSKMPQISRFFPLDDQLHIFDIQFDCSASYAPNLGIFHSIPRTNFLANSFFLNLAHKNLQKHLPKFFRGQFSKRFFEPRAGRAIGGGARSYLRNGF